MVLRPLPKTRGMLTMIAKGADKCRLRCECGKEIDVATVRWRYREMQSCGCERAKIHKRIIGFAIRGMKDQ